MITTVAPASTSVKSTMTIRSKLESHYRKAFLKNGVEIFRHADEAKEQLVAEDDDFNYHCTSSAMFRHH